ncbi:MAG: ABC transporter permease [Gammaproteobacteria bacterium]|nr:ABC transporter permease [Gammaproteobacteria bacterium]
MFVAIIFIALAATLVWSVVYGRKVIRTEKTDAVFGNPEKAMGGWHWMVMGVGSVLLLWYWFSWDAARAFFPGAGNELCQVAKLHRAANPIRSTFPVGDNRQLLGTVLLARDYGELDSLEARLVITDFDDADRETLSGIIADMRNVMAAHADSSFLDSTVSDRMDEVAAQINTLADDMARPDYPGPADPATLEEALAQPGWGESSVELPPLPMTDRGRKFDAAGLILEVIAKDYRDIRNQGPELVAQLQDIEARIKGFEVDTDAAADVVADREDFAKDLMKIQRRIDDGRIFPPAVSDRVEAALIRLDDVQRDQQGSLRWINAIAMPGGEILAGNNACSEQGSGRWLPKPSDTLSTFIRMAHPDVGYKGFPLLWFKMKPVSEMVGFLMPDWIASLVPGGHPRHNEDGVVRSNLKSKVYSVVTGNFSSFSVPIPDGHIWDSIVRVLMGLFFGIILGVPLGLFMGLSRFAKGYFDPLIELYRPVPPLAWAPLILTIFGIQDDGKIFLLFMVAFAIMVISARTGATGTQLSKIHAAHSLGASNHQILRQVILPNSLPEILTGIRISIGVCWGTLVAAEMLAGTTGIGFVENVARKQSDYEIIWMTIIVMGVLGLIFDMLMRWVIIKSIPWRGKG